MRSFPQVAQPHGAIPAIPRMRVDSAMIAAYLCLLAVIGFLAASDRFAHWYILPVLACGVLTGTDAVNWFRGRLDVFDPVGAIGVFGVHFFFLAPLLHLYWNIWLRYIDPPPDWREWLGRMALLNLAGLILYRIARERFARPRAAQAKRTVWRLDYQRFWLILGIALVVSAILQLWVYARFGGVLGYIQAYRDAESLRIDTFAGMSYLFSISESFPILALIGFAIYARQKKVAQSWVALALVLLVFFVLKIFFGGLRGSRLNTIWGLAWAVGIIHLWIRPIPRKLILVGCALVVVFMYFYGLYKGAGLDAVDALSSTEARNGLVEETGRGINNNLLGDLGRSDVQAFLLYRITSFPQEYDYAWGRTYLGAASLLIPKAIWPDRPATKAQEGADAEWGRDAYIPVVRETTHVYGFGGETILNFGPIGIPLAFIPFGFAVGRTRRFLRELLPFDTRLLIYPFLLNLCFWVLVADSDNIIFILLKDGLVPFLVIYLASSKLTRQGMGIPHDGRVAT